MASEMEKNLSSVESIEETVTSCLGYATLKKEQRMLFCLSFVARRDVFTALPMVTYEMLHTQYKGSEKL